MKVFQIVFIITHLTPEYKLPPSKTFHRLSNLLITQLDMKPLQIRK